MIALQSLYRKGIEAYLVKENTMIEVTYDGKYPCACMGTLIVKVDGEEIYNKEICCSSSSSTGFTADYYEYIELGELTWDDASKFSTEIREAVRQKLATVRVCCGGCL